MVNPFDKPAEMQLMDTYVPLPFEEYMRAGQNMQNRLDAVKADTLKWEADNLGNKDILNQDIKDYNALRSSFTSELNEVMKSPGYLMSPEGQRRILNVKEKWSTSPELQSMLRAYKIYPEWSKNMEAATKQNEDYNTENYELLGNLWENKGTLEFQKYIKSPEGRKYLYDNGIDLDRMGIYDIESMMSAVPDSYVNLFEKYEKVANNVKASGMLKDILNNDKTQSIKTGSEGVAMNAIMNAYGITSDEKGRPIIGKDGNYIVDDNMYNLFRNSTVNNFDNQAEYNYRNYIAPLTDEEYKAIYKENKPTLDEYKLQKYVEDAHSVAYGFVWNKGQHSEDITPEYVQRNKEKREKTTTFTLTPFTTDVGGNKAADMQIANANNNTATVALLNDVYGALSSSGNIKLSPIDIANRISKGDYKFLYDALESAKIGANPADKKSIEELEGRINDAQIVHHNTNLVAENVAKEYVVGNNNAITDWFNETILSGYKSNVKDDGSAVATLNKIVEEYNGRKMSKDNLKYFNYLKTNNLLSYQNGEYALDVDKLTNNLVSKYSSEFLSGSNDKLNEWYDESPNSARMNKPTFLLTTTNKNSYAGHILSQLVDLAKNSPEAFLKEDGTTLTNVDLETIKKIVINIDGDDKTYGVKWNISYEGGRENERVNVVLSPVYDKDADNKNLSTIRFSVPKEAKNISNTVVESIANSQPDVLVSILTGNYVTDVQKQSAYNSSKIVAETSYENLDAQTIKSATLSKPAIITQNIKVYKQASTINPNNDEYVVMARNQDGSWSPQQNIFTQQYKFASIDDIKATLGFAIQIRSIEGNITTTTSEGIPQY